MIYFWVAAGGAMGTLGRFLLATIVAAQVEEKFPWTTLVINVTGSFAIGFFGTFTDPAGPRPATPDMRAFFMIGLCGGYTTFSSFSLQTMRLAESQQWLAAGLNVVASNAGCLFAVWLGHVCAQATRK